MNWVCPRCRQPLSKISEQHLRCHSEQLDFEKVDGIWRLLLPERQTYFADFIADYEAIRASEGRQSPSSEYYRQLPHQDLTGQLEQMWTLRAMSFEFMLSRLKNELSQPRIIVDLGAGNGWLSHQLSRQGHQLFAVDLTVNSFDGLGTHLHYDTPFTPLQAEFNRLPLPNASVDLIISNAAFHYSLDYAQTLSSLAPILKPDGQLVLLDTPFYHDPAAGQKMVNERHQQFRQKHGRRSQNLPHENFMTLRQLNNLTTQNGWRYQIQWPDPTWRRLLRRLRSRWQLGRESAQFPLVQLWPK